VKTAQNMPLQNKAKSAILNLLATGTAASFDGGIIIKTWFYV
jgi:hypothetical protein